MTQTTTVSARLPSDIVQRLDRLAREQSRSRTGQLLHELRLIAAVGESRLAELAALAASHLQQGDDDMTDFNTGALDPRIQGIKEGTVPDKYLKGHGSGMPPKDVYGPSKPATSDLNGGARADVDRSETLEPGEPKPVR